MSVVVFWDLDGTLLTTNRDGVAALEDAAERIVGERPNLSGMRTAGLTDCEIADAVIESHGAKSSVVLREAFLNAYAEALPARLAPRSGHLMPNVLEILERCREEGVALGLITGNVKRCAAAKLRTYGLDPDAFNFGGFAEDGYTRLQIGRVAIARCGGRAVWTSMYLIGDTPSDVAAGRRLECRTIAVATGGFSLAELETTEPWSAIPELPSPDNFMELIGTR